MSRTFTADQYQKKKRTFAFFKIINEKTTTRESKANQPE
jgi:hypothetical protein